jgi:hypothetical protein
MDTASRETRPNPRATIKKALKAANVRFDVREAIELRVIGFGLFDGIAHEDLPMCFPQE